MLRKATQKKPPQYVSFDGPDGQEDMPFLLTPGPLTTSSTVKLAMLADWGSRDIEFRQLIANIARQLLKIAGAGNEYECVLMQGSGTFAVEAALGSFCATGRKKKTLVIINGAYGHRAVKILGHLKRPCQILEFDEETPVDAATVDATLRDNKDIELVFIVHCETTTGVMNPLEDICKVCKDHGKTVYVDAMSSFGAVPIDMKKLDIDVLVSSANKCIEGVPGFGYVLCRRDLLKASQGKSHSVSLDLYDQWKAMEKTAQFRFTPPTHALIAFNQALIEHEDEGGTKARGKRYQRNCATLLKGMRKLGFQTLLGDDISGPIIQTFLSPADPRFDFDTFYEALRAHGFAIYPGKLTKRDSFRIGTIGKLDANVFERLLKAINLVLQDMGVTSNSPYK
ncbi:2-aminoethylphosphonate:pyruvate aminotransferase [hydrothermal vent metagenome]|uniref:2-aminoethylphosphonate--pyruvate transaminase n=1 Tax=hydrothermal vent metagenome TaxID=652676 RepID=A0A3B0S6K1_9ZZZZ